MDQPSADRSEQHARQCAEPAAPHDQQVGILGHINQPDVGHLNWTIDEFPGREALSEHPAGWHERYPDVSVTPKLINHDADRWLVHHSDGGVQQSKPQPAQAGPSSICPET